MASDGTDASFAWQVSLGRAVRARRKRLGLTQLEVADLAGCGPVFLYEVETGKKATLQLGKLLDLLSVLGLQLKVEPGREGLEIDEALR